MEGTEEAARWGSPASDVVEPEQIANTLDVDFPDDESMRISHEAIYQRLYLECRGALKRKLVAVLAHRQGVVGTAGPNRQKAWGHVTKEVLISKRPEEAEDRAVPGIGNVTSSSGCNARPPAPWWNAPHDSRFWF